MGMPSSWLEWFSLLGGGLEEGNTVERTPSGVRARIRRARIADSREVGIRYFEASCCEGRGLLKMCCGARGSGVERAIADANGVARARNRRRILINSREYEIYKVRFERYTERFCKSKGDIVTEGAQT